jgi:signal transduction histidine kinase
MIVVSRNILIHQALENTLQHFSLNGRGLRIFNARDLDEAMSLAEKNRDIILVMIDNNVQVNGSYAVFVDYIHNTLDIKNCCVTFKDNLINTSSCEKDHERSADQHYVRFYNARERLIDVSRMVMITTEMENKINSPGQGPAMSDDPRDVSWFTKEKLNTVMAHDLREPLGNIKIMLDFLTNEPDLLDKETSKDLLHRVRESANNVHELLEDYLFWSRMFKHEIYFNPGKVDMEQIARENIVLLKSTAASKSITVQSNVPENTFVFADEFMITTVIRNLVYNAIKFTPNKGEIVISTHTRDDVVEVRVADNGVGIPQENLEKLFRTDIRLSTSGTDKESGSGLGLVLCKDFIEKNGGNITIETEENKGTTFIFTLPAWSFAEYM